MTAPIRLALIGLGMATKPHLEGLAELRGKVEVSGLFNRTKSKAEAAGAQYGFPVFSSLDELLNDAGTDAVLLATPPNQREELVAKLTAAGKHILTEKPIERTLDAARAIVSQCESAGITLGVVFQHRTRESARRLRRLLDEGALGEIALVRANIPWWRGQDYYDEPGRGTYERDGGGVLISQAIHVLDLMLSLTGPVRAVQGFCATTKLHKMESEDFAAAGLEFTSGATGSLTATTAGFPGDQESIIIDAEKGAALLQGDRLTLHWRSGGVEEFGEVTRTGGGADPMAFSCDRHRDVISDFAAALREGRAPVCSGREALHVHALIEAVTRSSAEGRRVEVLT